MSATARAPQPSLPLEKPSAPHLNARASNIRQLRLRSRTKVHLPALLMTANSTHAIEILNISRGGAGMSAPPECSIHQGITLTLARGRTLTAKIVWIRMGFAGVLFDDLLSPDDELLLAPGEHAAPAVDTEIHSKRTPNTWTTSASVVLTAYAAICDWTATLVTKRHHLRHKKQVECMHRVIEVACRKQGFSWLSDEEFFQEDRHKSQD